jgi:AcrR family transcriptional regulator
MATRARPVPRRAVPDRVHARRPAGPSAAASLQDRKRQLVKDEIARGAWELFDREGYEATTVEEIAGRAGISRRTFFRYYSSKEDVVVGTSDALAEAFLAAFRGRPAAEPPLTTIHRALRPVVVDRVKDADQGRAIMRLLRESATLRRAMMERHARMEERLAALLAARLGADPRRDPTPALLAFVARAFMDTAFNVWYDQQPADAGAMVDDLFRRLQSIVAPARHGAKAPSGRPAVRLAASRRRTS